MIPLVIWPQRCGLSERVHMRTATKSKTKAKPAGAKTAARKTMTAKRGPGRPASRAAVKKK